MNEKQKIDWPELFRKIRASGRLLLKVSGIGAVVALVIAFSIPTEYTASTLVAHEGSRRRSYEDIRELANITPGMSASVATERDALYPSLYSAIIRSTPFLLRLSDIEVRRQEDSVAMPLSQYLSEHRKTPWWKAVTSAPFKLAGWCVSLFREKPNVGNAGEKAESNPFRLTRKEAAVARIIASGIKVEIDKKKKVISINVTMQDPLVAATVADSVQARLKAYMTEYRSGKARKILEYNEKLCREAQDEYYAAQDKYTRYADANQSLAMLASRAELIRLRSEMELALMAYNRMERQVRAAKARVEKVAPVYTVIQPVTVPLHPSGPHRLRILAGCILLGGAGTVCWILYAKDFIRKMRKRRTIRKPMIDSK